MLFFRYFGVFGKSQFDCNIISFAQSDGRGRNSIIRSVTWSKQALDLDYAKKNDYSGVFRDEVVFRSKTTKVSNGTVFNQVISPNHNFHCFP